MDVFSDKVALTDTQIAHFCLNNKLPFSLCQLTELKNSEDDLPATCFVFTGNDKNDANNGYTNHWLLLAGPYLFDSYGYQSKYSIGENYIRVKTTPQRLQEFNSDVCGEYCCRFLHYYMNEKPDYEDIGQDFVNKAEFKSDQAKNDQIVLSWFKDNA